MKKKWLISNTLTIALLIIVGLWLYFSNVSYPLGDRLEYIGKENYGCWLVCDSNPGSVYYYATDMSVEEVEEYFKEGTKKEIQPTAVVSSDGHSYDYSSKKHALSLDVEDYASAKASL